MELDLDVRLFLENIVCPNCKGKSDDDIKEYIRKTADLLKGRGWINEVTEELKQALFEHIKKEINKASENNWGADEINYNWIAGK